MQERGEHRHIDQGVTKYKMQERGGGGGGGGG